jgi:hypothetical protein
MIEEIHIFGVFIPAALMWAALAGLLSYGAHKLLQRLPADSILWQPGLRDLALFLLFWWGISALADRFYFELIVR